VSVVTDIISSDHPLTHDQRLVLAALLDTLVPASEDGAMPSAADADFDGYLRSQAADFMPQLIALLAQFESSFAELSLDARCERVRHFSSANAPLFQLLLSRVYDCYYQDARVRSQIGVVAGALFPHGNEVPAGDLSLLDPVIANSARHRYRET
jgi:hypothetical protein